jgi:hypothetical protein
MKMACQDCGTEFHARADAKFCSVSCRQHAQRRRRDDEIESLRRKLSDEIELLRGQPTGNQRTKLDRAKAAIRKELEEEFRTRLEAELNQYRAKLDADFAAHKAAYDAQNARINALLDKARRRYQESIEVYRAKGLITLDDYNTIRSCLHPDSRVSATDKKLATAFRLFNDSRVKTLLVKEK